MKNKLVVGQTVYYLDERKLVETKITKVGKKYFEIEDIPRVTFSIETMYDYNKNYSPTYYIYQSLTEYEDEKIANKLYRDIRDKISTNLGVDKLRAINEIINA